MRGSRLGVALRTASFESRAPRSAGTAPGASRSYGRTAHPWHAIDHTPLPPNPALAAINSDEALPLCTPLCANAPLANPLVQQATCIYLLPMVAIRVWYEPLGEDAVAAPTPEASAQRRDNTRYETRSASTLARMEGVHGTGVYIDAGGSAGWGRIQAAWI
ncbi:hypothetical protein B0H11DRAFT_2223620 [Mycena galericulata]|nr:hypothetical protein B0H11DRAFT_2223620 [Mycena galericulata]